MPRKPRIFATDAIYHVYCRTARGELVFNEHEEIERWIDTVAVVAEQDGMAVFAWCLLENHFHMVVQTQGAPLFRPMARIQGRVAKGINRRNGWTGRLWQSRYKARLVTTHLYLRHLFAYVHLNPVAAGLVADPSDHGPTGHRALLGLEKPRLVDVGAALLCFQEDPLQARADYQDTVRAVAEARWLNADVRELPWWRTVDDDDETVPPALAPCKAELFNGEAPPSPNRMPSLDAIIKRVEAQVGLAPEQLRGRGRTRYEGWCRCLVTTLCVGILGYRARDLARCLNKSSVSVSRWLSEGRQLQLIDPGFRDRLSELRNFVEADDGRPIRRCRDR